MFDAHSACVGTVVSSRAHVANTCRKTLVIFNIRPWYEDSVIVTAEMSDKRERLVYVRNFV